jgi:hypothetical protein
MMRILLIIVIAVCCASTSLAQEGDILEFAAKHPRGEMLTNPDGTYRIPKFGDHRLERAVEELKDYQRPWTMTKVLAWYEETKDGKIRAHLLWVLAVSRDPRAALALGNALGDGSLDVRVAATYGLLNYFMRGDVIGGTEQHMIAVKEWWKKNREIIQKESERLRLKATPDNSFNRIRHHLASYPAH